MRECSPVIAPSEVKYVSYCLTVPPLSKESFRCPRSTLPQLAKLSCVTYLVPSDVCRTRLRWRGWVRPKVGGQAILTHGTGVAATRTHAAAAPRHARLGPGRTHGPSAATSCSLHSAQPDTIVAFGSQTSNIMPNQQTCNYYIQLLQAGANLPQSARTGLINMVKLTLLTMVQPAVQLIQGNISNPTAGSSFPHIVVFNGAPSAHDEACEWQQYKSRMTHITVELRDAQGAPPARSCPHVSRLAGPRPKLHRTSAVPRVCGRPASPGKHAAAGRPGASADVAPRHDWAAALGRP